MAFSNPTSTKNTNIPHSHKNPQTETSRETYNKWLQWSNRNISSFDNRLLQPIAIKQKSYLKDTTDLINFIEKTKVSHNTILVSTLEEGINTVCKAYNRFYNDNPPIPSHYLKEMLGLILKENLFQFNGISKFMEWPWELKWQFHLPTFSWRK